MRRLIWGLLFIAVFTASCNSKYRADLAEPRDMAMDYSLEQKNLEELSPEQQEQEEQPKILTPEEKPSLSPDFKYAGLILPTVYFKPVIKLTEQVCPPSEKRDVLDKDGNSLVKLCEHSYKECLMQGSCLIKDKKSFSINHLNKAEGAQRFFIDEICEFGQGVASSCLDPYFTVAADMEIYQAGDVIYIPAMKGALLPNKQLHTGFFIVRDTGDHIKGPGRFDFFNGLLAPEDENSPLYSAKLRSPSTRLDYYLIQGETAKAVLSERKYPKIPSGPTPNKE